MKNVGTLDRNIRLGIFAVLLTAGFLSEGNLRLAVWGLSAVMAVTAMAGFCPIWALFKVNTIKK